LNTDVQAKLEKLKINYSQVKGQPFSHFFCPILFRDENVPLCKAHIVNEAFLNSARAWTIQRKDVDSFYGSTVEAEFLATQYNDHTHSNIFVDKKLSKLFKPQILVDGNPIDFFIADGQVPKQFTRLELNNDGQIIKLGIKMSNEDFLAAKDKNWEMSISKDVRMSALVSLIKAAHLTMFEMLGYQYALTAGSHFVGWNILGKFFIQNQNKSKPNIFKNAHPFFRVFAYMVRPVQQSGINFQGTITDNLLFICKEKCCPPWAHIVFVKTSQ
jgi:hypothetical protein